MTKAVNDDWEVLESATNRGREGLFISISPAGRVSFSRDLTKLLDPKLPRCTMKYSISLSKLRFMFQREITANSHLWRVKAKAEDQAYFSAESALRAKNLVPEKVTLYTVLYCPAAGDQAAYVEVDMAKALFILEPPRHKQEEVPPENQALPLEKSAATGKCAECGQIVEFGSKGRLRVLLDHKDPSGIPCYCRRPERTMRSKQENP